jgi:hypothetical protein
MTATSRRSRRSACEQSYCPVCWFPKGEQDVRTMAGNQDRSSVTATVLGFVATSLLPSAYLAVTYPLSADRSFQSVLGWFVVFYFFAAAATVLLGVPAYLILKKFNLVVWWSALGYGTVAGALVSFAVAPNSDPAGHQEFAMLGGVAGLLFWVIRRAGHT